MTFDQGYRLSIIASLMRSRTGSARCHSLTMVQGVWTSSMILATLTHEILPMIDSPKINPVIGQSQVLWICPKIAHLRHDHVRCPRIPFSWDGRGLFRDFLRKGLHRLKKKGNIRALLDGRTTIIRRSSAEERVTVNH